MRTLSAREVHWSSLFTAVLVLRLLFPFFDSPLAHLYSDPLRHWENGRDFLHPSVMGSGDPYLYQLWLFSLQWIAGSSTAAILAGCGALCAAMPYGWYRALRELMPRTPALVSAVVIGLWPAFLGPYAYFMTETMLLTLTGFGFWLTLRALRKRSLAAFAFAFAVWLAATFTRIVLLPIGIFCLVLAWIVQPHKWRSLALALLMTLIVAIPAGLHARSALGYFSPLGNLYLNEIYHASGARDIQIDYGAQGSYMFGSPSYYNPTFYPFSDWTTSRQGIFAITVDTQRGRADWRRWLVAARAQGAGTRLRDFAENVCYLLFGQAWPDNDRTTRVGWLELWLRWCFLPIILLTTLAAARGLYRGREWLLPVCALMGLLLLAVQREGIMEGRYRKPIEPIFLAALTLSIYARSRAAKPS
jgi:4-amino-4-deoxy-L-arabinose transferase-like glycosyltransferase